MILMIRNLHSLEMVFNHFKNRMRTSKYWVKRVGSEEEGDGLRKAVVHLSAALKIMFLLPTPQKCDPSFLALK